MHSNTETSPLAAYAKAFTTESIATIDHITDGSINDTYEVTTQRGEKFILQRMSSIFEPSVMDNLAIVEPFVKAAGVLIPHGIKTVSGDGYIIIGDGGWYRALTYIPGVTIHKGLTTAGAKSAGRLVGQFHSALVGCDAVLHTAIPHFHDTHYYFERMQTVAAACTNETKKATLEPIVAEINTLAGALSTDVRTLPQRIIHADLKVSNIRFNEAGEAVALIDMDTMMQGSVVTEMGDALRSWCGTAGEDSSEQVFDTAIFEAAMAGYRQTAKDITEAEINAIPEGIRILTLELASRFVTDAYEESYFAKSSLYASLYEQNMTRAKNQLLFLKAFETRGSL